MRERDEREDRGGRGDERRVDHVGSKPERIGEIPASSGVSTGGHMPADAPAELPGDMHGAGTAERNRDRSAGLGEGLAHEGADVPNERSVGGDISAADAGGEIVDALEERLPRRGPPDQTADPNNVPPPR
jgi:hypothetical protein